MNEAIEADFKYKISHVEMNICHIKKLVIWEMAKTVQNFTMHGISKYTRVCNSVSTYPLLNFEC